MKELLIIGGSDAGISAALRAREVDPSWRVRLVIADGFPNFSICGLPFYLSGETPRWENLAHRTRSEIIVGAGYIGMEMADALRHRGLEVTVFDIGTTVLQTVDPELGRLVQGELERHDVKVCIGAPIEAIEPVGHGLAVRDREGVRARADMVLVATGVRPSVELAKTAGLELGERGALRVNRAMQSNVPDVYAAGDCVETHHRLVEAPTYLPLGTTAHKQGRVAGENAVGGRALFAGSLGTQVVKVFDLVIGRTGFRDEDARRHGFEPRTVETKAWDHKASKQLDVFATAIFHGMQVDAVEQLDLSYTPPLSSPCDPVQTSCMEWAEKPLEGRA